MVQINFKVNTIIKINFKKCREHIFQQSTKATLITMSSDEQKQTYKSRVLPILKGRYPLLYNLIDELILNIGGLEEWISITKHIVHSTLCEMEVINLLAFYRGKIKLA